MIKELKKAVPPKPRSKYRNPNDEQPFLNNNALDPTVRSKEESIKRFSVEQAEKAARAYDDREEFNRLFKEDKQVKKASDRIAVLENLDSTPDQVSRAATALDRLADTLPGRELFRKAFIERGYTEEHYAILYKKSYDLGTDDSLINDELDDDGNVVKQGIGHRLALECRKEARATLDKVHGLDRKEEETAPKIMIIIGSQMENAAEELNKRYPMDSAQWTKADS